MSAAESWSSKWGGGTGILGRLTDAITGIFRPKAPLKRKIAEIMVLLDEQQRKLDEILYRLEERSKDLFDRTVKAYVARDMARAAIYAGEVAEVRKMAKTVTTIKLALEKVSLRLETVHEIGEIGVTLVPLMNLLKGMRQWVTGIVPEVAYSLDEILRAMNEVILEAGTMSERTVATTIDEDTMRILEEAKSVAELKVEERFPKLPHQLEKLAEKQTPSILQPATPVHYTRIVSREDVERKVLEYAKKKNGFLDVSECARELGIDKELVIDAISSLRRKGKIRLGATG